LTADPDCVFCQHLDDEMPVNWRLKPGDVAHIEAVAERIGPLL
jgi:hypothetical protein